MATTYSVLTWLPLEACTPVGLDVVTYVVLISDSVPFSNFVGRQILGASNSVYNRLINYWKRENDGNSSSVNSLIKLGCVSVRALQGLREKTACRE